MSYRMTEGRDNFLSWSNILNQETFGYLACWQFHSTDSGDPSTAWELCIGFKHSSPQFIHSIITIIYTLNYDFHDTQKVPGGKYLILLFYDRPVRK